MLPQLKSPSKVEVQVFKRRGSARIKLHSGSDWPVYFLFNLILRPSELFFLIKRNIKAIMDFNHIIATALKRKPPEVTHSSVARTQGSDSLLCLPAPQDLDFFGTKLELSKWKRGALLLGMC